jgi:cation diffusion facilitator CzcD-associated flavoprotein CzcO
MAHDEVVTYLEGLRRLVRGTRTRGQWVRGRRGGHGRRLHGGALNDGSLAAKHVVLATGALQRPNVPADAEIPADVAQILGADYRHPSALPAKGVLIIGKWRDWRSDRRGARRRRP